jgi:hypothetical protein
MEPEEKNDDTPMTGHHPGIRTPANPFGIRVVGKTQPLEKKFHSTLADMLANRAREIAEDTDVSLEETEKRKKKLQSLQKRLGIQTEEKTELSVPSTPVLSPMKVRPSTPTRPFQPNIGEPFGIFSPGQSPSRGNPRFALDDDPPEAKMEEDVGLFDQGVVPLEPLPLDVALPGSHLMKFVPAKAPINDVGNGALFHQRYLDMGGMRARVAIPGGYMDLRPKSVTIRVQKLSFATRQELRGYIAGRFPVGGVILNKTYSNTALLPAVYSMLPGKVVITY